MVAAENVSSESGVFCTHQTRRMTVSNPQRGHTLVTEGEVARTFWQRFRGLMGRSSLPDGYGLLFIHENWIHMFFMRIPLDVLHLDDSGRVIRILESIRPWRVGPFVRHGTYVLELPAGSVERTNTAVGDILRIAPRD